MRKHFLILMLMALLPLAGWAASGDPVKNPDLVYSASSTGQQLIITGSVSGKTYYYASVPDGTPQPTEISAYTTEVPKAINAGDYDIWWFAITTSSSPTAENVAAAQKIDASIAPLKILINAKDPANQTYGTNYATLAAGSTFYVDANASTTPATGYTTLADATTAGVTVTIVPSFKGWLTTQPVKYKGTNVDSYEFTIEGYTNNSNYAVEIPVAKSTGKIKITQATLTIKPEWDDATKTTAEYGEALPSWHASYDGLIAAENANDGTTSPAAPKAGVLGGTLDYTLKNSGLVNYWTEGTFNNHGAVVGDADTYAITPTGLTSKNYNINFTPINLVVKPKVLTTEMIQQVCAAPKVYNGEDQQATDDDVIVKVGEKTLAKTTDYTYVTKDENGDPLGTTGAINAGTYKVTITGNRNYSGEVSKTFVISKRALAIYSGSEDTSVELSSTYGDAEATVADNVKTKYYFRNLVADDEDTEGTPKTGVIADGVKFKAEMTGKNAGEYPITVKAYKMVSTDEVDVDDDEIAANYVATYVNGGVWTIKQFPVQYTLKAQTFTNGRANELVDAGDAGLQITKDNYETYFETAPELKNSDVIDTYPKVKYNSTTKKIEVVAGTTFTYKHNEGTTEAPNYVDVSANYKVKAIAPKAVTALAGQLIVSVNNQKAVYGDAAKTLTVLVTGGTAQVNAAAKAYFEGEGVLVRATAGKKKVGGAEVDVTYPNVGVYAITAPEYDATQLPADYTITVIDGKYTIEQRELKTITAKTQTLTVDKAATGVVLSNLAAPSATTIEFALAENDTYKLTDNDRRLLYSELGWKMKDGYTSPSGAGTFEKAIEVKLPTNGLTNFKVTGDAWMKAANLIVIANAIEVTVDRNKVDDAATADVDEGFFAYYIAQNNGRVGTIKFTNERLLKPQVWTAMVLPFDITVAKLSAALGYAVVNTLAADATAENVKFELNMGTLAANTPFLVKTSEEVDMNNVVFEEVVVKAPASADAAVVGNDAVKFHGVYNEITRAFTAKEWITANNKWWGSYKHGMKPLAAYVEIIGSTTNAPVFTVQDENGYTTAISAIKADGTALEADGWYTLNGVKLQGAPVEKGVYVRNGKKVVIK